LRVKNVWVSTSDLKIGNAWSENYFPTDSENVRWKEWLQTQEKCYLLSSSSLSVYIGNQHSKYVPCTRECLSYFAGGVVKIKRYLHALYLLCAELNKTNILTSTVQCAALHIADIDRGAWSIFLVFKTLSHK
jgi:hypothetical protein